MNDGNNGHPTDAKRRNFSCWQEVPCRFWVLWGWAPRPRLRRRRRGDLLALRFNNWKISFKEQCATSLDIWRREFTNLRAPKIYNLRSDPFERGDSSFEYDRWVAERAFLIVPSQAIVGQWLSSFKEFPIRQKPASFNLDEVMEKLSREKQ